LFNLYTRNKRPYSQSKLELNSKNVELEWGKIFFVRVYISFFFALKPRLQRIQVLSFVRLINWQNFAQAELLLIFDFKIRPKMFSYVLIFEYTCWRLLIISTTSQGLYVTMLILCFWAIALKRWSSSIVYAEERQCCSQTSSWSGASYKAITKKRDTKI